MVVRDHYCSRPLRKDLADDVSLVECWALADADPECGNQMYSGGTGSCRCILKGLACDFVLRVGAGLVVYEKSCGASQHDREATCGCARVRRVSYVAMRHFLVVVIFARSRGASFPPNNAFPGLWTDIVPPRPPSGESASQLGLIRTTDTCAGAGLTAWRSREAGRTAEGTA